MQEGTSESRRRIGYNRNFRRCADPGKHLTDDREEQEDDSREDKEFCVGFAAQVYSVPVACMAYAHDWRNRGRVDLITRKHRVT